MHVLTSLKRKKLLVFGKRLFAFVCACVFLISPISASASTIEELQQQIDKKNSELAEIQKQLDELSREADQLKSERGGLYGEVEQLENQIAEIETQVEYNELKKKEIEEKLKIKELEVEKSKKLRDDRVKAVYMASRSSDLETLFSSRNISEYWRDMGYKKAVMDKDRENIDLLTQEINKLKSDRENLTGEIGDLSSQNDELMAQKEQLDAEIAQLNSQIASNQGAAAGLRGQMGAVQTEIDLISSEQKSLIQSENNLGGIDTSNGGTLPLEAGEYYFKGRGRDAMQGHGLGLSQFGAYGAALKGWSAHQILTFYYTDTYIGTKGGSIDVEDYGTMDIEDYVAGLGEIPDYACETPANRGQPWSRPDDPNTVWDCWPEESIKAQVIAARSYAFSYNGTICTSAACQVYQGDKAKKWAADATRNQVVMHGGSVITAVYSSDNHNGWGTASRDTVWNGFDGNGFSIPYLKAVNDSAFTYHYIWTDWGWRTNSYSIEEIQGMLNWAANSWGSSASSYIGGVLNSIGTLQTIDFERGPSGRVKKVKLNGSNGSAYMAGWLFKNAWNSWIYSVRPSGQYDYIFSLTYYLYKAE